MSQPTTLNYLDASNFAYNSGSVAGAPEGYSGTLDVKTRHFASANDYDALDRRTGFYGAAYTLGSGSDEDVVISFEGTNLAGFKQDPEFSFNEIRADYELYKAELPTALKQAATFAQAAVKAAISAGIPTDHIFLTGHSLGGAEAEYADIATGLQGVTFGAPGISSNFVPSSAKSGLTDYVERGDPVGNYAYTGPHSPEGPFIYSDTVEHFGVTQYLGSKYDAIPLEIAGQAYGTGTKAGKDGALAGLLLAAGKFHLLDAYAESLVGHKLTDSPVGATSFNGPNLGHIVSVIAQNSASGAA